MPSRIAIAKSSHFACAEGPAFSAWESPAPDPASREAACAILHEAQYEKPRPAGGADGPVYDGLVKEIVAALMHRH